MDDEIQLLCQDDIDELIQISGLLDSRKNAGKSLYSEICKAILDSGKLDLDEWRALHSSIDEIVTLMAHIELIIKLKEEETLSIDGEKEEE
jgi:hypothetical protein